MKRIVVAIVFVALNVTSPRPASAMDIGALCNGSDLDQAIAACTEIIGKSAEPAARLQAFRNRAIRLTARNRPQEAFADIDAAISLGPQVAILRVIKANLLNSLGKPSDALSEIDKALSINANLPEAYTAKGLIEYQMGSLDNSISDSSKAISLDAHQFAAYNNRAAALRDKGDYEHALTDLNVVVRTNTQSGRPLYNRGLVFQRKGDLRSAQRDYEAALIMMPNDMETSNALAAVKLLQSQAADKPPGQISPGPLVAQSEKISSLACEDISHRKLSQFERTVRSDAGAWGVPLRDWSPDLFTILSTRARECDRLAGNSIGTTLEQHVANLNSSRMQSDVNDAVSSFADGEKLKAEVLAVRTAAAPQLPFGARLTKIRDLKMRLVLSKMNSDEQQRLSKLLSDFERKTEVEQAAENDNRQRSQEAAAAAAETEAQANRSKAAEAAFCNGPAVLRLLKCSKRSGSSGKTRTLPRTQP